MYDSEEDSPDCEDEYTPGTVRQVGIGPRGRPPQAGQHSLGSHGRGREQGRDQQRDQGPSALALEDLTCVESIKLIDWQMIRYA
ncbi:Hypothetical predicted protein [Xyrichtys novacula]|uniref:Uncharacterized protein n=1 Tax=Xyrichtys novacula TaxID=13765 RepID=A0AAV1HKY7_XYRNO|nr:Hypothetical predicted protein [Xyrichtys novacula]